MVRETELSVDNRPARIFVGGRGEPLVLVHGGWGGASMHWRSVWTELAERFHVIAPDLPGIGDLSQPGLGSVGAYAQWLRAVLDGLDVESAWLVGNSFGASVISRFALDFPDRCRGLVFVNGFPMPRTPSLMRWLGERRFGKGVMRAASRFVAFSPRAVRRGFFDAHRVPDELRAVVQQKRPPQLLACADALVQGGGSSKGGPRAYPVPPLLLWGENDRLPGTSKDAAVKLQASWPGSTLVLVPRAGHMPQLENPGAFVEALDERVRR